MTAAHNEPRGGSELERQALVALRKMRERLDAAEAARQEPLAIVGAACRLPGAPDIDSFWELLCRGGDAVAAIPPERWEAAGFAPPEADAGVPRHAGLLPRIDAFDAEFFGISDREAQWMDPQQRIFLEVVWEALERAGIPPLGLKGSRTGVFVGTTTTDYLQVLSQRLSAAEYDAYIVSGNTLNATAGRVSYTLGLQGPALAIDTACSSSLVAIDRACRSVRDGESRLAIAGGVNLVLTPQLLWSMARWGMLSSDGRCKTFDAAADGFVRAEGCGVVLIKRLSDAQADGDQIWALVRGSAVNQAGASGAFAVPNGPAQAQVMRDALAAAHIDAASVGYIEAHGTGTPLGDPIEMEAIASVYGTQRTAGQPLLVGAVKSNVGHLEAAAGVTGLLKTVLALRHRQIPPNVHFAQPTPHIPWDRIPVRVPTRSTPFPAIAERRLAAVSAFGFSGTNAHVVLEEAPAIKEAARPETPPALLLTLSARNPIALTTLALRHADRLASGADAHATCLAASTGRSHLSHRLAVTAPDATALVASLRSAARGVVTACSAGGRVDNDRPAVAFVFTGQGAQYRGMGRQLSAASTVFRDALQRCAAVIDPLLDRPLLPLILGDDGDPTLLDRTSYTQPALFAIQYALVAWWRSVSVTPALVLGHSVGEFAAACCAGVLTLDDAAALVTRRGALMQSLPAGGAMASVFAPESAVRARMTAIGGVLAVAGINGPDDTVVSGDETAVRALTAACLADGVRVEPLTVSHAFHSPLMQPMLARFIEAAHGITTAAPRIGVVSSMTGELAAVNWATADYWSQQLHAPVRWFDAVRSAAAQGIGVVIEIGPQPVLCGLGRRALPHAPIAWLPSLRRGQDNDATIMATLGELYVRGIVDDWAGRAGVAARTQVDLPPYPFQPARHWVRAQPHAVAQQRWVHPLLGTALPLASGDTLFESVAGDARHGWVREHRFGAAAVWPAAASIEMLLAAVAHLPAGERTELHDITFAAPLVLHDDGIAVHTLLGQGDDGQWTATMARAPDHAGQRNAPFATARALRGDDRPAAPLDRARWLAREPKAVDMSAFYAALDAAGVAFGPMFRRVAQAQRLVDEAFGRIDASDIADDTANWHLHPALLDGCLQLVSVADGWPGAEPCDPWVPSSVERITLHRAAPGALWCHVRLRARADGSPRLMADLSIWDADGAPVASLDGVTFVRSRVTDLASHGGGLVARSGIEITWQRVESPAVTAVPSRWLIVGAGAWAHTLADALRQRGADAEAVPDVRAALNAAHVVHLAPLDLPDEAAAEAALPALQPAIDAALRVVQAVVGATHASPRLWWITRQAQAVRGHETAAPLAATFWGLARVLRTEHPELRCTAVDIDASCEATALAGLLEQVDGRESQLAVREGQLWVARLRPLPHPAHRQLLPPASQRLSDVAWAPLNERAPRAGEVRIAVRAAGLNFRDVLRALGMTDGPAEALGGECAGTVTAVGTGVTHVAPGDEVVALAIGGMATSVCVPDAFVAQRPAGLSDVEAAALPIACLTASYGLEELASLRRGERVLIHAATGGVGLAAVQLAQYLGAEVFATAGSDAKRERLRALGVAHVMDSRSLAFRDEILTRTGGAGVHVVLNALAGDFIAAGLSVVAPRGCFLEMGKRGVWSTAAIAAHRPDIRYHVFDLGDAAARDATLAPRLFARLFDRLQGGELTPLPVTAYPLRDAAVALQTMAQARHIGKLVLRRDLTAPALPTRLRADAAYLITGGFGALGLHVADALAARGARHVILVGRHEPSPQAQSRLAALEARGVVVQRMLLDVADGAALHTMLAGAQRTPPLRGVIHAAGVIDDAPMARQHWARFAAVLRPKLQGALHLAAATADSPLDFFVLFSAGAAWLGNAAQANYAAANAALDALAHTLRARGVPATAIAWGRWSGDGMAADRADGRVAMWRNLGIGDITPDDGVAAMFELIERQAVSAAVLPVDWTTYVAKAHGGRAPACFDPLLSNAAVATPRAADALGSLQALPAHERRSALLQLLEAQVRQVAELAPSRRIDPHWPLRDVGVDSLMSVELRNALGAVFGRTLSATLVFDHPTLQALADHLMRTLNGLSDQADSATPAIDSHAAAVGSLTEQEAEAELLVELARGEPR